MGGSSGGSSTTVDKDYNRRIAQIAEAQQRLAEEMQGYYRQYGLPTDVLEPAAGSRVAPYQTASQIAGLQAQMEMMPYEMGSRRDEITATNDPGIWGTNQTMDQFVQIPNNFHERGRVRLVDRATGEDTGFLSPDELQDREINASGDYRMQTWQPRAPLIQTPDNFHERGRVRLYDRSTGEDTGFLSPDEIQSMNINDSGNYMMQTWQPGQGSSDWQRWTAPEQTGGSSEWQTLGRPQGNNLYTEQARLTRDQIASQREILPEHTGLTLEQIAAQRELLPHQTGLSIDEIETRRGLLPQASRTVRDFWRDARDGVDVQGRMGLAQADITRGYQGVADQQRMADARMGLRPDSGAAMMRQGALQTQQAGDIAGARTLARHQAKQDQFQRLQAAGTSGLGYLGGGI